MSLSTSLLPQVEGVDIGPRAAVHLLNRIGYGPRPGQVAEVLRQGLEKYINEQVEAPADPELEVRLRAYPTLGYPIGQVLANYNQDQRTINAVLDDLNAAKIVRAAHGRNQLQEALVDFWYNHFNVYVLDGFARYATAAYERDAIRPHVLGRFRDLLGATAQHPAMVYYLDNYLSTVSRVDPRTGRLIQGLNENYGRELMELHTVGVDAGYTQDHVFDSARCFTGWGLDQRTGAFVYRSQNHDTGAKQVFGLSVPAGGQREDGERLLDHLASHPATARHVSWQLAQRFVADDPPERVVNRAAGVFLDSGGDIAEVMKALLGTAEFWAEAFGTGKPKSPWEFVISALRAVDAQVTGPARGVVGAVAGMGMPLYQCLPPTGYSNRGTDWLNPSSHLQRMNFALDLAAGAVAGATVDVRGLVRRYGGNADEPSSVVTTLHNEVFGRSLSADTRRVASRVSGRGTVNASIRAVGLVLAGPELQGR
jgi:uncharacterized protein (DUF1800 family)